MWGREWSEERKYEVRNTCFLLFVYLGLILYMDMIYMYIERIYIEMYILNMKAEGNCMEGGRRPMREQEE